MAHFAQKSLATAAIILSFLAADLAFAATAKSMKTAQATEDPDLKLSIQELKEKYPPSLLKEKNKTYKSGQKINIDDYSVAEIKAAFLNADENFKDRKITRRVTKGVGYEDEEVVVSNQHELDLMGATCDKLGTAITSKLPKNQKILQSFIFSNRMIRGYVNRYVSIEIGSCLSAGDPLGIEDRD